MQSSCKLTPSSAFSARIGLFNLWPNDPGEDLILEIEKGSHSNLSLSGMFCEGHRSHPERFSAWGPSLLPWQEFMLLDHMELPMQGPSLGIKTPDSLPGAGAVCLPHPWRLARLPPSGDAMQGGP